MNCVVWDIETDSAQLDWVTMIEVGAILLDENFKEKERFSARCRMPQDRVPSATALCINKSNVDLITKGNLSHYQMIAQVEKNFVNGHQQHLWDSARLDSMMKFLGESFLNH